MPAASSLCVRPRLREDIVERLRLEVVQLGQHVKHPVLVREVELARLLEQREELALELGLPRGLTRAGSVFSRRMRIWWAGRVCVRRRRCRTSSYLASPLRLRRMPRSFAFAALRSSANRSAPARRSQRRAMCSTRPRLADADSELSGRLLGVDMEELRRGESTR